MQKIGLQLVYSLLHNNKLISNPNARFLSKVLDYECFQNVTLVPISGLYTHFAYIIYKVNLSHAACPRSDSGVGNMGLKKIAFEIGSKK